MFEPATPTRSTLLPVLALAAPVLVALALALVLAAAASASSGFGLLSGPGGCLVAPGAKEDQTASCGVGKALLGPNGIAVSADGKNVYVVSGVSGSIPAQSFGSLAVLKRDPSTGTLSEVGCLSSDGTDGRDGAFGACTPMPSLLAADGVAVSPDGSMVFVTASSSGSVIAFSRDAETGLLARVGCYQFRPPRGSPCAPANVFPGSDTVALSVDGRSLFVASPVQGALSTFAAPPAAASGSSSGVAGLFGSIEPNRALANPCIAVNGFDGSCAVGIATGGLDGLSMAPDGKQLYGVAAASDAVDGFTPGPEGTVSESSCLEVSAPPGPCSAAHLMNQPTALAISPDGLNLYAADSNEDNGQVDVLTRDPTTGALSDSSCVDDLPEPEQHEAGEQSEEGEEEGKGEEEEPTRPDPCVGVPGLSRVAAVAVSGDGSAAYALGQGSAVVFSRDGKDGKLTEVSCSSNEDTRCTSFPGLQVRDAVVSPDGREVYVAGGEDNAVYAFGVGSTIATGKASATRSGLLRVRLDCPSGLRRPCAGRVVLTRTTFRRAGGHGRRRVIARAVIARSAHFTIPPGRRAAVATRLSSAGRRLLARRHRLRLTTVIRADPSGGGSGYGRSLTLIRR